MRKRGISEHDSSKQDRVATSVGPLGRVKQWLTPPVFPDNLEKTELARLVYPFVLGLLAAVLAFFASVLVTPEPLTWVVASALGVLSVILIAGLVLARAGHVTPVGVSVVVVLWVICSALILLFGGIHDEMVSGYYLIILVAGVVLGGRGLVVATGLSGVVLILAYALEIAGILDPSSILPSTPRMLLVVLLTLATTGLYQRYAIRRFASASREAMESSTQLSAAHEALEAREGELSVESERLRRRLKASMAVSWEAAASLASVDLLMRRTARVISSEFGFYHTGVFWIDPSGEWFVLQAASSEVGQRMLARGFRVPMDTGVLGTTVSLGEARIVTDVALDPDLSQTRSRLVVPLRLGRSASEPEQIIGVLDLHSTEANAFSEEDVSVLQVLADQLSLAIGNARLLAEANESVEAAQRAYGETTLADWEELLRESGGMAFVSGPQGTWSQAPDQQPRTIGDPGMAIPEMGADSGTISIPIRVAGKSIGAVEVRLPWEGSASRSGLSPWTQERVEVLEQLATQLSQAVERARLYQETQNAALLEQMIGEVTSHVRAEVEIEAVLERALAELGQALGADRGSAFLSLAKEDRAQGATGVDSNGGEDRHD